MTHCTNEGPSQLSLSTLAVYFLTLNTGVAYLILLQQAEIGFHNSRLANAQSSEMWLSAGRIVRYWPRKANNIELVVLGILLGLVFSQPLVTLLSRKLRERNTTASLFSCIAAPTLFVVLCFGVPPFGFWDSPANQPMTNPMELVCRICAFLLFSSSAILVPYRIFRRSSHKGTTVNTILIGAASWAVVLYIYWRSTSLTTTLQ